MTPWLKKKENQFFEKTRKERLTIPGTVSLVNGDLQNISVDLLFLGSETTGLLKTAGFKTIADIIHRFNTVHPDFLQEDEGKEVFEMAVYTLQKISTKIVKYLRMVFIHSLETIKKSDRKISGQFQMRF